VGWSTTAIFGHLNGYFFGIFRDKASNIIWRYANPCRPVIYCKMNDLKWPSAAICPRNPSSASTLLQQSGLPSGGLLSVAFWPVAFCPSGLLSWLQDERPLEQKATVEQWSRSTRGPLRAFECHKITQFLRFSCVLCFEPPTAPSVIIRRSEWPAQVVMCSWRAVFLRQLSFL